MGQYTEIYLNCEIKSDTPKEVIDILKFLFNKSNVFVTGIIFCTILVTSFLYSVLRLEGKYYHYSWYLTKYETAEGNAIYNMTLGQRYPYLLSLRFDTEIDEQTYNLFKDNSGIIQYKDNKWSWFRKSVKD